MGNSTDVDDHTNDYVARSKHNENGEWVSASNYVVANNVAPISIYWCYVFICRTGNYYRHVNIPRNLFFNNNDRVCYFSRAKEGSA